MTRERVIYKNSLCESVEFRPGGEYHMSSIDGLADMSTEIYSQSAVQQVGNTFIGQRLLPRYITLIGAINTIDRGEKAKMIAWLAHVLSPLYAGTLIYEFDGLQRLLDVKLDSAPIFNNSELVTVFTIRFAAMLPLWRGTQEKRDDASIWRNGLFFPMSFPTEKIEFGWRVPTSIIEIENNGDVDAALRVIFTAQDTVINPYIQNALTMKKCGVKQTLLVGDRVEIHTYYGDKTVTLHRDGASSDWFAYFDPNGEFISLPPGKTRIKFGADEGEAAMDVMIYHSDYFLSPYTWR